ncbi:MAG: hypothetical protein JRI34_04500, partial [Deltaproteobacteria bacterium]|nr:hypothetical protein [Deltaproteobacteria bacterium]
MPQVGQYGVSETGLVRISERPGKFFGLVSGHAEDHLMVLGRTEYPIAARWE